MVRRGERARQNETHKNDTSSDLETRYNLGRGAGKAKLDQALETNPLRYRQKAGINHISEVSRQPSIEHFMQHGRKRE
jgi:hypothetical protein